MTITVYSKPNCVQCTGTYRALDKLGATYEVIDITTDPEAMKFVMGSGQQAAPVVLVTDAGQPDVIWGGYRPDRIAELAGALQTALVAA